MIALSSSGLAKTLSKHAASISVRSSIPDASFTPSRKPIGDRSSKIVPSGNYSGIEYLVKIDLAVLPFSIKVSAIFIKQCSATSSISSSSMYFPGSLSSFLFSSSSPLFLAELSFFSEAAFFAGVPAF